MIDRKKIINELRFQLDSKEVKDQHYPVQLSASDANAILFLLKEQESEWLEDSDPGQEYGTTWACWKCHHSIHKPYIWNPYESGYKYCLHCGAKMN